VTRNENCQGLPKLEHDRKELNDDEILNEWHSQKKEMLESLKISKG
jgi:hypothetical protein